ATVAPPEVKSNAQPPLIPFRRHPRFGANMTSTAPARRPFGRPKKDEGPRATFGQLLPYVFEHKGPMAVVVVLSVLGAAASLAQPLLVSQVIGIVESGKTLGLLVW